MVVSLHIYVRHSKINHIKRKETAVHAEANTKRSLEKS